jgi:hypothetical protein
MAKIHFSFLFLSLFGAARLKSSLMCQDGRSRGGRRRMRLRKKRSGRRRRRGYQEFPF